MITPYNDNRSKKEQVSEMFDSISPTYDKLNHLFSLGIDKIWRRKAVKELRKISPKKLLDIATGTGDFAIACSRLNPDSITGADISEGMLEIGRQKVMKAGLDRMISFQKADAENMPFADNTFDAATVAFGVRNFENLENGLKDILRVLKPGGRLVVLEFSKPRYFPVKQLYFFYFRAIVPFVGRLVSKDRSAYAYLPESVLAFPDRTAFTDILARSGFRNCSFRSLSFGIVCLYVSEK